MKKKISDYEKDYNEFWKDTIEKDGAINKDQMMRELSDYHTLMGNVAKVYCHITNNRIGKQLTDPEIVISVADEIMEDAINGEVEDAVEYAKETYKEKIERIKEELKKFIKE